MIRTRFIVANVTRRVARSSVLSAKTPEVVEGSPTTSPWRAFSNKADLVVHPSAGTEIPPTLSDAGSNSEGLEHGEEKSMDDLPKLSDRERTPFASLVERATQVSSCHFLRRTVKVEAGTLPSH